MVGHRVVGGGIRRDGDGVEVPGRAARTGRETLRAPAKAEGRWCHETVSELVRANRNGRGVVGCPPQKLAESILAAVCSEEGV